MVRPPPPSSPPSSGVSVFVRVRNIPTYEKSLTAGFSGGDYDPVANVVRVDGNTVFIADPQPPAAPSADPVPRESDFSFDGVLAEKMTQEAVYDKAVRPLIERCLDGYNGTVFCYGQTASGKTFTMQGPSLRDSKPDEVGIVQRVAKQIIDGLKELGKRVPGFTATLSYLEIYNEKLSDLISADSKAKKELKISIDPDSANLKDHYVSGLTEMVVSEVDDYLDVIVMGAERRKVGATDMNAVSSRSHSVLTITIDQRSPISDGGIAKKRSKINLVDLAGSERADSTGATGERLKEGAAINQSLSCLGNVVNALSSGKATHIPYRDSKLTYLLQDSLGGNSLTVMIACVTPTAKNYQESMSTLRFATRVKKGVKNVASLNVDANVLRWVLSPLYLAGT
ncbi:P-loop containing nucleoside triphosphate hydrolase protein [Zopfochytrium polystomum]|nr:P-loop containing nucleoside triphosphate hydrolase protein [Zopfochytrium polystomum]